MLPTCWTYWRLTSKRDSRAGFVFERAGVACSQPEPMNAVTDPSLNLNR